MKIRRIALRLWIAGASVFTFLVGLAMLSHAPKPVQPGGASQYQAVVVVPTMQTLAPMAQLDFSGYFDGVGPQVSQYSVQDQPTPIPQPQIVVPQPPITVQQQASSGKKKGNSGAQQGGGSGGSSGGGGLSTSGS